MSKSMWLLFTMIFLVSLAWREQDVTIQRNRIDESVLGFGFGKIEDYQFACSVGNPEYSVWGSAYHIDQGRFTIENLRTLFRWVAGQSGKEDQVHALVVSDLEQARWLFRIRGASSHSKEDPTIKPEFASMVRKNFGMAEYYRDKDTELFWYRLPGKGQEGQRFIIRGTDPLVNNPIPLWVVGTELKKVRDGSECVRRRVYVIVRACDMTRTNLIDIFTRISKAMPYPREMQVDLAADRDLMESDLLMNLRILPAFLLYLRPESMFLCERPPVPFRTRAYYYRSVEDSFFYYFNDSDVGPAQRVRVP